MAQKIEYGNRTYLRQFKPKRESNPNPLYLLIDATRMQINQAESDDKLSIKNCFCPECNKMQPLSDPITIPKKGIHIPSAENTTWAEFDLYNLGYYRTRRKEEEVDVPKFEEIACPECGHRSHMVALHLTESDEDSWNGAYWETPLSLKSRTLSKCTDENNRTTRIDDRAMIYSSIIHEDGTVETKDKAITETIDLVKNDIYATVTFMDKNNKVNHNVINTVDPFYYPDMPNIASDIHFGVRRLSHISYNSTMESGYIGWNRIISNTFNLENVENRVSSVIVETPGKDNYRVKAVNDMEAPELLEWGIAAGRQKVKEIEQRFEGMTDSLYHNGKRNGMYLQEHHPGSNEENTKLDYTFMNHAAIMMVCYPGVYLHAAERTERILEDKHYAELRKQKENPDYEIKTPSDSGRARIFRAEFRHVAEELCAADDKITKNIKGVETPKEMRSKLEFFVYGPGGERTVPKEVRLDENNTTKQNPFKATKALKRAFAQEPIAVASNVYTGTKLKIKTTDHLNQLMEAGNNFAETEPKRARRNGSYVLVNPPISEAANAGIISPVRNSVMMSFMKRFSGSHNPTETIQALYGDSANTVKGDTTTGYGLAIECLRMYDAITARCKIADKPEEINQNFDSIMKNQMKNYLEHNSLQQAYVDFIERFGENTPAQVNKYAAMVLHDKKMSEAFDCYQNEGLTAAIEKHPVLSEMENPQQELTKWKEETVDNENIVLTTRNGKSLFQNRTLKEIHDELSVMSTKCLKGNKRFTYSEKERDLEKRYPAPDADGEWSFHLMEDSNDMVRTATQMYNCVGGQSYVDDADAKRCTLLYMEDETAQRVGCIELKPRKRNDGTEFYAVTQFQGPHDNAIESRFAGVAKQWLKDCNINYSDCSDVAKFGTDDSLYGARDADYHNEELDEADGVRRTTQEMKDIQKKRIDMAIAYYGQDINGSISVPAVPDELMCLM